VVLGDAVLAEQLYAVIDLAVYGSSLGDDGRREINRLRMRMENELAKETAGNYNIKTGRGGIVDVEFIVQYLQLCYGCSHHELRSTNTIAALKEIRALGLVSDTDSETLYSGYLFLRKLENRLRIIHDYSVNDLSGPKNYMDKLARRLGYDPALRNPGAVLISDYEEMTGKIRDCYDTIMGKQVQNGEEP
jgi:glutamate-ammonia-ligase adenylyltransferase